MHVLKNSITNFLGGIGPAIAMLISMPIIINHIGLENYGLLTIITSIIGYFSIIDINFTAGSIKYISEFNSTGNKNCLAQTITLGFITYVTIGIIGSTGIYFLAEKIAVQVFSITSNNIELAIQSFHIGAIGFFISQIQQYLNSLPQSVHRFDISAKLENIFGIATPALSVIAIILWQADLIVLLIIRVLLSTLHTIILCKQAINIFPDYKPALPDRELARLIFSFSSYSFLSKIASVTYAHGDKLIIGATLGMTAVSIYSIPSTIVNRFLGMTFRLSSVIFPIASELGAKSNFSQLELIYLQMSRYINYLNAALVALMLLFSHEILTYWIGSEIAQSGSIIFSLIAMSLLIDTLTNLPSLVNDGLGGSKVSGLFSVGRASIGMLTIWVLAQLWGTAGVALGHLLASIILAGAFVIYVHGRTIPISLRKYIMGGIAQPLGPIAILIAAGYWIRPSDVMSVPLSIAAASVLSLFILLIGWFFILLPCDRQRWRLTIFRH